MLYREVKAIRLVYSKTDLTSVQKYWHKGAKSFVDHCSEGCYFYIEEEIYEEINEYIVGAHALEIVTIYLTI